MDILHLNCAGLDVHKDTVVACSRRVIGTKAVREVRTFKTMTSDLLALSEWLGSLGCTAIVMEATGVYWKPVWNILSDGDFELTLVNAAHVKNVPAAKRVSAPSPQDRRERRDVAGRSAGASSRSDASHRRLVRASFVPDMQTQEQRVLLRTRKQLSTEGALRWGRASVPRTSNACRRRWRPPTSSSTSWRSHAPHGRSRTSPGRADGR